MAINKEFRVKHGLISEDDVQVNGSVTATSFIGDGSQLTGISSFSGNYNDLTNKPVLFSGNYNDLSNLPNLVKAAVEWSPNHTLADGTRYLAGDVVWDNGNIYVANYDNESLPTSNTLYWTNLGPGNRLNIDGRDIPNISYTQLSNTPSLSTVATSGSYNDLSDKPTIPSLTGYATETYVNTQVANLVDSSPTTLDTLNELAQALGDDPNFATTVSNQIGLKADSSSLATVATSGSYNDLSDKPTIPDVTHYDDVLAVTGEPMGHEDKTQSAISFDAATRIFTIAPVGSHFDVWVKGTKHTFTTAQTVTLPNTTGEYYIYFDENGLGAQTSYFVWDQQAPTALIYYNSATGLAPYFADERHGTTLDWQTHEYLHRTRGAVIANGFTIGNYTVGGAVQLDIGNGTFFDEDLHIDVTHSNTPTANTWQQDLQGPAQIPMFYLSGTGWVRDNPTGYLNKQGTSRPRYNLLSGGTWSTADIDNNKYSTTFIVATNNLTYPIIGIISQSAHASKGAAEALEFSDLVLTGFPVAEFRLLYKVVFQANTTNGTLSSVWDLRQLSATTPSAAIGSDHGLLSGLGDDDHPQYLLRTDTATVATSGSYNDLTDKPTITPAAVSDQNNTSTGFFKVPTGTTAERPVPADIGMIRYNTSLGALENYTLDGWLKVSIPIPILTSVSGTIYNGISSTLTLSGSSFGTTTSVVRFSSGAIVKDVSVTPASTSSASVTVPSEIYNLGAGSTVSIKFINGDGGQSSNVDKTVAGLPSGGTFTSSGGYYYHKFTSSGNLVVPSGFSATAEVLIVAGGGGGGYDVGGGGGAGGVVSSSLTLSTGTYTATVGAGGANSNNFNGGASENQSGSNSSFTGLITAIGGGKGGSYTGASSSGGSGGGGGGQGGSGGSGTSGQGNAGSSGTGNSSPYSAGGGGGAGGAASGYNPNGGGHGGIGTNSYSTWASATSSGESGYFAGGGGGGGGLDGGSGAGGTGGLGGGGNGHQRSSGTPAESGQANTGGGGGGTGSWSAGGPATGAGGSGIVIIRYTL